MDSDHYITIREKPKAKCSSISDYYYHGYNKNNNDLVCKIHKNSFFLQLLINATLSICYV